MALPDKGHDRNTVAVMGRLADADWWWISALDGVVGGLIGGLTTAVAVWLTLRHERRLAQETSALESGGKANAMSFALAGSLVSDSVAPEQAAERALALSGLLLEFTARTASRWPPLATRVLELNTKVVAGMGHESDSVGADMALEASNEVSVLIAGWMTSPDDFRQVLPSRYRPDASRG